MRLSQSDVAQCRDQLCLISTLNFPNGNSFGYQIKAAPGTEFAVHYDGHLTVEVPKDMLLKWSEPNGPVGIYRDIEMDQGILKLSIERDFKCLDERPGEDEVDLFPNPKNIDNG